MFVRKKVNKSGSVSVQVISKIRGKFKLIKTIGSPKDEDTIKEQIYFLNKNSKGATEQLNL